tara:strand:- start:210 stop:605 length:396 start_codon:yes stop_codon:yes gene_type:complete
VVKSNLVTLGIVLGILGLLLIGGAYLSFSQASESFDESMENSDAGCESFFGFCWFLPGGSFGCGFCLLGILLGFLTVGFLFSGSIFAIVGATLQTPDSVIVVEPLPPPAPPVGMVEDEFADLERDLDSLED